VLPFTGYLRATRKLQPSQRPINPTVPPGLPCSPIVVHLVSALVTEDRRGADFASGVGPWRQSLGKVRDAVRQELVTRQLVTHLPPASAADRPRVLDVGCGQGTQAIRLARMGYDVTGVDVSDELLDVARAAAAAEAAPVAARLHFAHGDLLARRTGLIGGFDVVCCHGVLMYLPSLHEGIAALVRATRTGGVVSVLTRNRAGIAMRAGMSGDWSGALAGFEARYYRNRLGIEKARADDVAEVADAFDAAGAPRLAWYGVRLFSDHWETADMPVNFDDLVAAEEHAGRRDPYRAVTALIHSLARKQTPDT
jgi:S-adenosylmethionine-dependent methyltransferase